MLTSELPTITEKSEKKWERNPDPAIQVASEALHKLIQKPQRSLYLENLATNGKEGVYILPRWEGYKIEALGQRRSGRDLLPRGSSAHNVSFCTAELRTPQGTTIDMVVAVKTFNQGISAINDALINAIALQRGIPTSDPIAVIVESKKDTSNKRVEPEKRRGFIVAKARKDIQALDTEPWHQFETGSPEVREYFTHRLMQISQSLADLHSVGITHGDPQIKNFWAVNTDEVEPFDWESARISSSTFEPERIAEIALSDLETLFRSLTNQIDTSPIPAIQGPAKSQWEQFKQLILDPYEDELLNRLGKNESQADQIIDSIYELERDLTNRLDIR